MVNWSRGLCTTSYASTELITTGASECIQLRHCVWPGPLHSTRHMQLANWFARPRAESRSPDRPSGPADSLPVARRSRLATILRSPWVHKSKRVTQRPPELPEDVLAYLFLHFFGAHTDSFWATPYSIDTAPCRRQTLLAAVEVCGSWRRAALPSLYHSVALASFAAVVAFARALTRNGKLGPLVRVVKLGEVYRSRATFRMIMETQDLNQLYRCIDTVWTSVTGVRHIIYTLETSNGLRYQINQRLLPGASHVPSSLRTLTFQGVRYHYSQRISQDFVPWLRWHNINQIKELNLCFFYALDDPDAAHAIGLKLLSLRMLTLTVANERTTTTVVRALLRPLRALRLHVFGNSEGPECLTNIHLWLQPLQHSLLDLELTLGLSATFHPYTAYLFSVTTQHGLRLDAFSALAHLRLDCISATRLQMPPPHMQCLDITFEQGLSHRLDRKGVPVFLITQVLFRGVPTWSQATPFKTLRIRDYFARRSDVRFWSIAAFMLKELCRPHGVEVSIDIYLVPPKLHFHPITSLAF